MNIKAQSVIHTLVTAQGGHTGLLTLPAEILGWLIVASATVAVLRGIVGLLEASLRFRNHWRERPR